MLFDISVLYRDPTPKSVPLEFGASFVRAHFMKVERVYVPSRSDRAREGMRQAAAARPGLEYNLARHECEVRDDNADVRDVQDLRSVLEDLQVQQPWKKMCWWYRSTNVQR